MLREPEFVTRSRRRPRSALRSRFLHWNAGSSAGRWLSLEAECAPNHERTLVGKAGCLHTRLHERSAQSRFAFWGRILPLNVKFGVSPGPRQRFE